MSCDATGHLEAVKRYSGVGPTKPASFQALEASGWFSNRGDQEDGCAPSLFCSHGIHDSSGWLELGLIKTIQLQKTNNSDKLLTNLIVSPSSQTPGAPGLSPPGVAGITAARFLWPLCGLGYSPNLLRWRVPSPGVPMETLVPLPGASHNRSLVFPRARLGRFHRHIRHAHIVGHFAVSVLS